MTSWMEETGGQPGGYASPVRRRSIAGELPQYPLEWNSDQRLAAYWHMISAELDPPRDMDGWHSVLRSAARRAQRTAALKPAVRHTDTPTGPKVAQNPTPQAGIDHS